MNYLTKLQKSAARKREMIRLRRTGRWTMQRIALKFGVTKQYVAQVCKAAS